MRIPFLRVFLLLASVGVGCDDEGGSAADVAADAGDAAVEAEAAPLSPLEVATAFCATYNAETCARVARCGCGAEAAAACEGATELCVADLPAVRAALEAGSLTIDAAAADALVADLSADAGCQAVQDALEYSVADVLSWRGLLEGTAEPGEECAVLDGVGLVSTCRRGFCIDGACLAWAGPDEGCDDETICLHVDLPASLLSADTAESSCGESGSCNGQLEEDGVCRNHVDCQSGFCDGARCAPKVEDGGRCFLGVDCQSGHCDIASSECAAALGSGDECIADSDCASGYCAKEAGQSRGECDAPGTRGQSCQDDQPAGCQSGACFGGACVEGVCASFLPL